MKKLKATFFLLVLTGLANAENSRLSREFLSFVKNDTQTSDVVRDERKLRQSINKVDARVTVKRVNLDPHSDGERSKNLIGDSQGSVTLKRNRLSVEERRALRRQIHDANHDLYISKK